MMSDIVASLPMKDLLKEYDVDIANENVIVEKGGQRVAIPAETVVFAFGFRPNNKLAEELKDICDVKVIDGAVKTSNGLDATRNAFEAAMSL